MARQKFSPSERKLKKKLRGIRLEAGHSMKQASKRLGTTVKALEDIETVRPYGRFISAEILFSYKRAYGISLGVLD